MSSELINSKMQVESLWKGACCMNPLWALLSQFLIIILMSGLIYWLIRALLNQNQKLESLRNQQVQDLLNRLMTVKWENYQVLTSSRSTPIPIQDGEGIGLSDENEMRRLAELLGQEYPIGETIVETGLDEYDRRELGLDLP